MDNRTSASRVGTSLFGTTWLFRPRFNIEPAGSHSIGRSGRGDGAADGWEAGFDKGTSEDHHGSVCARDRQQESVQRAYQLKYWHQPGRDARCFDQSVHLAGCAVTWWDANGQAAVTGGTSRPLRNLHTLVQAPMSYGTVLLPTV